MKFKGLLGLLRPRKSLVSLKFKISVISEKKDPTKQFKELQVCIVHRTEKSKNQAGFKKLMALRAPGWLHR